MKMFTSSRIVDVHCAHHTAWKWWHTARLIGLQKKIASRIH